MSIQEVAYIKKFVDNEMIDKYHKLIMNLGFIVTTSYLSTLPIDLRELLLEYLANNIVIIFSTLGWECYLEYKNFQTSNKSGNSHFRQRIPHELLLSSHIPVCEEYTTYNHEYINKQDVKYRVNFSLTQNYLLIVKENESNDKLLLQY